MVLHMVGSGRMLEPMRELAAELGMADQVVFLGQLSSGRPVTQFLDGVDLYLNASRQEGLPKALVEAMARACPAIGRRVAGMPEILPGDCLVPAEDVEALGGAVAGLLADTQRMSKGAVDNWKRARDFSQPVLRERSREFYAECLRRSQANDPVRLSA